MDTIEQSRLMGEYYRDLSLNYEDYIRTNRWPDPPFKPVHHVTIDFLPE